MTKKLKKLIDDEMKSVIKYRKFLERNSGFEKAQTKSEFQPLLDDVNKKIDAVDKVLKK